MPERLIECVPNFSEGRDSEKVRAIAGAIAGVKGIFLLGWESDPDHNRSVFTLAGEPELVLESVISGVAKAAELIDLRQHSGVHPRVGAADVVPFVPLEGVTIEECAHLAHRAGEEIWRSCHIPVYFYESAARDPGRRRLEKVRRTGFDGKPPDIGDIAAHPTAGASVVGARDILIACNVMISPPDVAIAGAVARAVRESSGGLRYVKAMGVALPSRGLAQISMNLTKFEEIPVFELYEAVRREAALRGAAIVSRELVGFIPRRAYEIAPEFYNLVENFTAERVIETRLEALKSAMSR